MFSRFTFLDQMEENIKSSLYFPYHINFDKLIGNGYYNKEYPDSYHSHSFEDVVRNAYKEPNAFYLTEEDKEYYSNQEINFINKVISFEQDRIKNGMTLVDLNLSDETLENIEKYKFENNLTFEEAIADILRKAIKEYTK